MNKKVVYILGAGASWQSIPTYTHFTDSLIKFVQMLESSNHLNQLINFMPNNTTEKSMGDQIVEFTDIARECQYFGTPDTYATSLRGTPRLLILKKLLSAFLTFLQMNLDEDTLNKLGVYSHAYSSLYNTEKKFGAKGTKPDLDRRYISLFSSLLIRNNFTELNDVSFITWNYDTQIEKVLHLYFQPEQVQTYLKNNVCQLNGNCQIPSLAMNLRKYNDGHLYTLFHYLFDKTKETNNIKFSWERSEMTKATDLISNCDCVVLIGYSVPDYNRLTDSKIFNHIAENDKMVYIQDLNPELIRKKLSTINYEHYSVQKDMEFNHQSGNYEYYDRARYELIDYTTQFVIPEEYWS